MKTYDTLLLFQTQEKTKGPTDTTFLFQSFPGFIIIFLNFRIHYIPKIGSDVYVVYNQFWDEEDDFITLQNTGMLKVDYLFRF